MRKGNKIASIATAVKYIIFMVKMVIYIADNFTAWSINQERLSLNHSKKEI
jgi:hypothetical protein